MVGLTSVQSTKSSVRSFIPPSNVEARHTPAEIRIVNRPAEITADWRQVWDELGLKRLSTLLRENKHKIAAEFVEELGANVRQGDEAGDLRQRNSPNIFGRQAYEDYMRRSKVEVVLDVAPKTPIVFDVRIHPPEIHVETHVISGSKPGKSD